MDILGMEMGEKNVVEKEGGGKVEEIIGKRKKIGWIFRIKNIGVEKIGMKEVVEGGD